MTSRALVALTLGLLACETSPSEVSFFENVGNAFEECRPSEIQALARKHNFMLAFEACGSNNFGDLAWSPAGTHLYFQLPQSHHIMHADSATKDVITVPTDAPIADAAWLDANRIAIPVGPERAAGSTEEAPSGPPRIEIFDQTQLTVRPYTLTGLADPRDLQGTADALYFTAVASGRRGIYRLATDDGALSQPFEWSASLVDGIDTFTYEPSANLVAIGAAGKVGLFEATTGEPQSTWPRAQRGIVQPGGEWLALEYEGDAIPLFYQRAWDELSPRARERERRRAEAFEQSLPDWYPTEIKPPRFSVVKLANGERWDFTGFYGDHFEWYAAEPDYASFVLWGFESKQLNTNILLGNLRARLHAMEDGEESFGLARWRDATTPPPINDGMPVEATGPGLPEEEAPTPDAEAAGSEPSAEEAAP